MATQGSPEQQQYLQAQQYQQAPQYQQPQQYQQSQHYQPQQYQQTQQQQPQHYPQAQTPQPYQQSQPYIHNSGYQQPQYPQQQPSQQYPQQGHQQQQYPQQGYQPQYPPQGHPQAYPPQRYQPQYSPQSQPPQHQQQQYQPQQYPHYQQHGYQQSYSQTSYGSRGQPPVQQGPQTCYNCGLPDHFAQNCPEPKRDIPAGALNRQKRQQKSNFQPSHGYINTNFSGPPQTTQPQYSPQGYAPTPYPQSGYPNYQPSQGLPTPQSAQSPNQQQWHHQNQHYHHSQQHRSSRQGSFSQQSQHNSYPTPATPTAGPYFRAASQTSPGVNQQGQEPQLPQKPNFTQAPVQDPSTPLSPSQPHSQTNGQSVTEALDSTQLQTRGGEVAHPSEVEEPEEDDLKALDVPDLPQATRNFGHALINIISMPVPANFVVADALWPIPPPAPEDQGRCRSKYLRKIGDGTVIQDIKDTPYWKDIQGDPMFLPIVDDGNSISVQDCRSKIQDRQKNYDEVIRQSRSQSRSVPTRPDVQEMASSLETLERALEEAKAKHAELIRKRKRSKQERQVEQDEKPLNAEEVPVIKDEHQSPLPPFSSEPPTKTQQSAEDVLAALGVTGSPKPVSAPTRLVSQGSPPNEASQQRSNSLPKAEMNSSPYGEQQVPNYYANGSNHYPQQAGYPPPPPPLVRTPSLNSGFAHSPPAGDTGYMDPYGCGTNGTENGEIYYQSPVDKSNGRKRSYDHRDSPSDDGDSPRRQEDDVTPKIKRRQPQVAEAYSRRW